jgi:hypothetical protein
MRAPAWRSTARAHTGGGRAPHRCAACAGGAPEVVVPISVQSEGLPGGPAGSRASDRSTLLYTSAMKSGVTQGHVSDRRCRRCRGRVSPVGCDSSQTPECCAAVGPGRAEARASNQPRPERPAGYEPLRPRDRGNRGLRTFFSRAEGIRLATCAHRPARGDRSARGPFRFADEIKAAVKLLSSRTRTRIAADPGERCHPQGGMSVRCTGFASRVRP